MVIAILISFVIGINLVYFYGKRLKYKHLKIYKANSIRSANLFVERYQLDGYSLVEFKLVNNKKFLVVLGK